MFNYGSIRVFVFKVVFGTLLVSLSLFILLSLLTHSSTDPGFGKILAQNDSVNIFGFYGAMTSSFFIIIFGMPSLIIGLYLFYTGTVISLGIIRKHLTTKFVPQGYFHPIATYDFIDSGIGMYQLTGDELYLNQARNTASELENNFLSDKNLILCGHSSGCVNALQVCNDNKEIKTAVLMDPVDNSMFFQDLRGKQLSKV